MWKGKSRASMGGYIGYRVIAHLGSTSGSGLVLEPQQPMRLMCPLSVSAKVISGQGNILIDKDESYGVNMNIMVYMWTNTASLAVYTPTPDPPFDICHSIWQAAQPIGSTPMKLRASFVRPPTLDLARFIYFLVRPQLLTRPEPLLAGSDICAPSPFDTSC